MPTRKRTRQPVVKRGEKVKVTPTDQAVPIKGVKAPRPGPTIGAAIDRRRQIVQPEDDRPARRKR